MECRTRSRRGAGLGVGSSGRGLGWILDREQPLAGRIGHHAQDPSPRTVQIMEGRASSDIEESQTFIIRADHGQDVAGQSKAISPPQKRRCGAGLGLPLPPATRARSGTDRFRLRASLGPSRGSRRCGRLTTGGRRGRLFRPIAQRDGLEVAGGIRHSRDSLPGRRRTAPQAQCRRARTRCPGSDRWRTRGGAARREEPGIPRPDPEVWAGVNAGS